MFAVEFNLSKRLLGDILLIPRHIKMMRYFKFSIK
jgi:hypothetical protein